MTENILLGTCLFAIIVIGLIVLIAALYIVDNRSDK